MADEILELLNRRHSEKTSQGGCAFTPVQMTNGVWMTSLGITSQTLQNNRNWNRRLLKPQVLREWVSGLY